jgi:MYXO-CTERM domain-containing protein
LPYSVSGTVSVSPSDTYSVSQVSKLVQGSLSVFPSETYSITQVAQKYSVSGTVSVSPSDTYVIKQALRPFQGTVSISPSDTYSITQTSWKYSVTGTVSVALNDTYNIARVGVGYVVSGTWNIRLLDNYTLQGIVLNKFTGSVAVSLYDSYVVQGSNSKFTIVDYTSKVEGIEGTTGYVNVTVKNAGTDPGSVSVRLLDILNKVVSQDKLFLQPGETKSVILSFTLPPAMTYMYTLQAYNVANDTVDDQKQVTVVSKTAPTPTPTTTTTAGMDIAVAVLLVLLLLLLAVSRRRRS